MNNGNKIIVPAKMPTLLYQCPSGISGDMNLGLMVALGVDPKVLEAELRKLPYEGWELAFEKDHRSGVSGLRCSVKQRTDHHHDHSNGHHHRTFKEIREAIEGSTLSRRVKDNAIACFRVLAEAEGAVHGIPPETVHFHEVGAIDSIIDMVGAAICWELLGVDRIICGTLEVGGGTVQCAHGRMPVPAPATARLLDGIPYTAGATDKETTTPTGAALLVGMKAEFGTRTQGRQIRTAIGIGQRDDPNLANVIYASLIDEKEPGSKATDDQVWEIATNLDDMSPEAVGYLCGKLRETGALEVWQTSATFKKDRLGCIVTALAREAEVKKIEACFFRHSKTLGVRRCLWQRHILERESQMIETKWGSVRVKIAKLPDGTTRKKFEHDDCTRIADAEGKPLDWVYAKLEKLSTHKI